MEPLALGAASAWSVDGGGDANIWDERAVLQKAIGLNGFLAVNLALFDREIFFCRTSMDEGDEILCRIVAMLTKMCR